MHKQEVKDEALVLRTSGLGYKSIARVIGVSWTTVRNWTKHIPAPEAQINSSHLNHKPLALEQAKTNRTRRFALIREQGHKCWICMLSKWNHMPIPLELDHIDGNRQNNSRDNLRIICPNCHAQTDTYKGKNMGRCRNWQPSDT